jgi:hypothetical protein
LHESHTYKRKAIGMTDCNTAPIVFSSAARRRVVADFDGGSITCDAGLLLLREVDRHLGLTAALSRCVEDPRDPERVVHDQHTLLAQRVFAIAAGFEDLNDHRSLRDDPVLQLASRQEVDPQQPLASAPTLCRLENRVDPAALMRMGRVLVEAFIASHKGKGETPPTELILDFDATHDPVHGNQVGRHFRGYYDCWCFLPLYVFCGEHLLAAYLRPSSRDAAHNARAVLALLVRRIRQEWPEVRIILRADSGFCRPRLLDWCEDNGVSYVLGLQTNPTLQLHGELTMAIARRLFEQSGPAGQTGPRTKPRVFGRFLYQAQRWHGGRKGRKRRKGKGPGRWRQVILRAECGELGDDPRFIISNLPGTAAHLYERVYSARGQSENRIKEQMQLFADRTSCHEFAANQFRLLLSSAAYVLLEHLRRLGLKGTELERAEPQTMRAKLLKIGARVVHSVRRVVLHLCSAYPLQPLFRNAAARLVALPQGLLALALVALPDTG